MQTQTSDERSDPAVTRDHVVLGLSVVWVIAIIALVIGAVSSSGPTMATSLGVMALAPVAVLVVLLVFSIVVARGANSERKAPSPKTNP